MIIKKILTSIFIINFAFLSLLTPNAQALSLTKKDTHYSVAQKSQPLKKDNKIINLETTNKNTETSLQLSEYHKIERQQKIQTRMKALVASASLLIATLLYFGIVGIKMQLEKHKKIA